MRRLNTFFTVILTLWLVACAPSEIPSEQSSSSSSSSSVEAAPQSSSILSSSSKSSVSVPKFIMTLFHYKNGKTERKMTMQISAHDKYDAQQGDVTQALNEKYYLGQDNKILEVSQDGKVKTVYQGPQNTYIQSVEASRTDRKVYAVLFMGTKADLETKNERKLVEMDIDSFAARIIDTPRPTKPYTGVRYISNTRRSGDVVYCVCGGEGGGMWQTYYLLTPDGQQEKLLEAEGSYGEDDLKHVIGFAYNLDSLVGYVSNHGKEEHTESDIFIQNIYLKQERTIDANIAEANIVLSPDGSLVAAFENGRHFIYSLSDGEVVRSRTKITKSESVSGFLSESQKTFWGIKYDGTGKYYPSIVNFDGLEPYTVSIGPNEAVATERPLGKENELLFYTVTPVQ